MDPLTVALMLIAALLHAGWHSLVKSGADQLVTLAGMGIVASTAALAAGPFAPWPPAPVWPVFAFPLARGMVPLFATLLDDPWREGDRGVELNRLVSRAQRSTKRSGVVRCRPGTRC